AGDSEMRRPGGGSLVALMALVLSHPLRPQAAPLERPPAVREGLEARWRGAWVVTTVRPFSDCIGAYTDNQVSGGLVRSRGRQAFEAGIPARIDSLHSQPAL